MYGLVNKAIEDMVCDRFGEETWEEIKKKAQLDVDVFISMDGYPDDVTHRLVKAASEILAISSSEILQAFGEYWVLYTAKEGYGDNDGHGRRQPTRISPEPRQFARSPWFDLSSTSTTLF
jgi:hypothetical protein